MGHCMGPSGVMPLVGSRGKAPKAPSILRINRRLSAILKRSKKEYEVMPFICKSMYILKICLMHYTLR